MIINDWLRKSLFEKNFRSNTLAVQYSKINITCFIHFFISME